MIRKPAVAGSFYPLDRGMLNRQIDECLDSVIIKIMGIHLGLYVHTLDIFIRDILPPILSNILKIGNMKR